MTTENELSSKKRNWEVKSRFSSVKMRPVKHSTSEETTTIALIHPVDRNLTDFFSEKTVDRYLAKLFFFVKKKSPAQVHKGANKLTYQVISACQNLLTFFL